MLVRNRTPFSPISSRSKTKTEHTRSRYFHVPRCEYLRGTGSVIHSRSSSCAHSFLRSSPFPTTMAAAQGTIHLPRSLPDTRSAHPSHPIGTQSRKTSRRSALATSNMSAPRYRFVSTCTTSRSSSPTSLMNANTGISRPSRSHSRSYSTSHRTAPVLRVGFHECSGTKSDIFRGVVIHVNGFTTPTAAELRQMMAEVRCCLRSILVFSLLRDSNSHQQPVSMADDTRPIQRAT